jgi:hypothetical protein
MMRVCSLLVVSMMSVAAACGGGDDGGTPPLPDATPPPDSTPLPDATPPATVVPVNCPGAAGIALEVTVIEPPPYRFGFTPDPGAGARPTIARGSVVRFDMQRNHNAVSGVGPSSPDGRFEAQRNAVTCLRFDSAGEFSFYCGNHSSDVALHQASTVVN